MLILIAESKTMAPCGNAVGEDEYAAHCPPLERQTDEIADTLKRMPAEELSRIVKISPVMAGKLKQMLYEFPNKATGARAIDAFTGVVFKALDARTMAPEGNDALMQRVRIISSLYGWLRPDDIIKAYRFDFTTPLAPEGKTFAAYWRPYVTQLVVEELQTSGCHDVLNLLPGDAARCIDWDAVKGHAAIWKADFREIQSGGAFRTPNAGKLKQLRGELLRMILQKNIADPDGIAALEGADFIGEGADPSTGQLLFTYAPR